MQNIMRFYELLSVILIAIVVSILSSIVLFGVLEIAPAVGMRLIMSAVLVIITITISTTVIFYLVLRRFTAERARKTAMMTLSEDEQKVVRRIMEMDEEVQQKDLWRELDFSRSKLSALLNNLTEKDVITKRRYRRTNLLRLTDEFKGK